MTKVVIISLSVFTIGYIMTMSGRGGGNFYVPLLAIAGLGMHQAATMGQFILMIAALTGMLVFNKKKMVDWKFALVIEERKQIYLNHFERQKSSGLCVKSYCKENGISECSFYSWRKRLGQDQNISSCTPVKQEESKRIHFTPVSLFPIEATGAIPVGFLRKDVAIGMLAPLD